MYICICVHIIYIYIYMHTRTRRLLTKRLCSSAATEDLGAGFDIIFVIIYIRYISLDILEYYIIYILVRHYWYYYYVVVVVVVSLIT